MNSYLSPSLGNASDVTNNGTDSSHSFFGLTGAAADGLAGGLTAACILGAGLASGLNLCLLSIDPETVFAIASDPYEAISVRNYASRVHGILEHQHWMMVTTLIWNALFAETLPLLLEVLVSNPFIVVVISTLGILIFGEILPQSFFTRYALSVAGFLSPVVWAMMLISSPLSIPIAKLLDLVLGHRPQIAMKRVELRELIALNTMANSMANDHDDDEGKNLLDHVDGKGKHHNKKHGGGGGGGIGHGTPGFTAEEVALLNGALNLSEKTVRDAMHGTELIEHIFMLEENQILTKQLISDIKKSEKTRIPVYQADKRNITGFIFSHAILQLIFMTETEAPKVKDCGVTTMARCNAGDLLVVLFKPFLSDAQDIALVHDDLSGLPIGIVTKWDLLSFLFNEEICAEKWTSHEADALALDVEKVQEQAKKRNTLMMRSSISASLKLPGHIIANNVGGGSGNFYGGGPVMSGDGLSGYGSRQASMRGTAAGGVRRSSQHQYGGAGYVPFSAIGNNNNNNTGSPNNNLLATIQQQMTSGRNNNDSDKEKRSPHNHSSQGSAPNFSDGVANASSNNNSLKAKKNSSAAVAAPSNNNSGSSNATTGRNKTAISSGGAQGYGSFSTSSANSPTAPNKSRSTLVGGNNNYNTLASANRFDDSIGRGSNAAYLSGTYASGGGSGGGNNNSLHNSNSNNNTRGSSHFQSGDTKRRLPSFASSSNVASPSNNDNNATSGN